MRPAPDIPAFAEALEFKRQHLGSDVVLLYPPTAEWPSGTAINPQTNMPFDPMIEPTSSAQSSATIRCGVFFKAVNRGGAEHAIVQSQIGLDDHTRIFVIARYEDRPLIEGAVGFLFHGDAFQIGAIKDDEIITGYRRVLIYGAAEGGTVPFEHPA